MTSRKRFGAILAPLLITLSACGASPVIGTWQAMGLNLGGANIDVTFQFTDTLIATKAQTNQGGSVAYTTQLNGTYLWTDASDGTHIHATYSQLQISTPQGDVPSLNTVCVNDMISPNCDGFQFTVPNTNAAQCLCKKQELVFKVSGTQMTGNYYGTAATFIHPL